MQIRSKRCKLVFMETPTLAITRLDQLDLTRQYSYADYLHWQIADRLELIRGYIWPMAAPNRRHQGISGNLHLDIGNHLRGKTCKVYQAPFDVRLPVPNPKTGEIYTVVQPDLCVVCDPAKLDEAGCNGAPDWVIEILSKGNSKKEMRDKLSVYEEAGVGEYWIVQPEYDTVLVYTLTEAGHYSGARLVYDDETLTSRTLPDLTIDLAGVFAE
jgi:Uma2 family endonuclease